MMKHKHADVLIAIAEGKEVEYHTEAHNWRTPSTDTVNPITFPGLLWRIKPEPEAEWKQKVRDALAGCIPFSEPAPKYEALAILDRALAAPEQEPVAWMYVNSDGECEDIGYGADYGSKEALFVPLYTAPPSREWQGLSDEERQECQKQALEGFRHAIKTGGVNPPTIDVIVEAALRAKNSGVQA